MGADQTFVKVDSSTLTTKANDLTTDYPSLSASAAPPCMLIISGLAMQKLDQNFQQLVGVLAGGKAEAARLAACLQAAGRAYDEADAMARAMVQSGRAPGGTDAVTVNPDLPPPAPPAPMGQCTAPPEDPGVDWESAVAQFNAGDQGSSLLDFKQQLYALSDKLTQHGAKFSMGNTHWEGKAAEAAEAALRRHESWLYDIAGQTRALAQQAQDFADVHISEHPQHPTQADVDAVNQMSGSQWLSAYSAMQLKSDDVRQSYANRVNFADMVFKTAPAGAYPSQSVAAGDVAPRPAGTPGDGTPGRGAGAGGGSGSGSGGGGGGQPSGPPAGGAPQTDSPSMKPAAAQGDSSQPQTGGGQSGGGAPSGGSGSGGEGSGSGGGGLPGGLGDGSGGGHGDVPALPDDATLTPAAAGGGAGSGGGGAGGGIGGQPLQPAASAPGLGTNPAAGGSSHGVTGGVGGAAGGGAMGGGMGGMGHGGQREGGKEKKRDPSLSVDEALYVEDRAYTDPVIGHTRRTKIEDKKEPK